MNIEIVKIIPEYIKTILSWPVIIFALTTIFINKFSEEISVFLKNARFFKAGPVELQSESQTELSGKTRKSAKKISQTITKKGVTLTEEQVKQLEAEFNKLVQETSSKDEQIKNKDQLIDYLVFRSELYEFKYLNAYLVQNTKLVLLWFNAQPVTKDYFNLSFQTTMPSPLEREAIFNALLNSQLIEENAGSFRTTDKATRFLKFIGFLK